MDWHAPIKLYYGQMPIKCQSSQVVQPWRNTSPASGALAVYGVSASMTWPSFVDAEEIRSAPVPMTMSSPLPRFTG